VFHIYVALASDSDSLARRLDSGGVQVGGYYRTPVHPQRGMERFAVAELLATDRLAAANLAVPIGTEHCANQAEAVVAACRPGIAA
jgi:hypothetical protein